MISLIAFTHRGCLLGKRLAEELGIGEITLTDILKERRRELPFLMRWYDIRRFAYNETPDDDVELHRTFYAIDNGEVDFNTVKDYVLPVKSKRYAQPILTQEIQRSHGQIQQNQY